MKTYSLKKGQRIYQLRVADRTTGRIDFYFDYILEESMIFTDEDIAIDPSGNEGYINSNVGWSQDEDDYHPCNMKHDDILMKSNFIGFKTSFLREDGQMDAMLIVHSTDYSILGNDEFHEDYQYSRKFIAAANASGFRVEEIITLSDDEIDSIWNIAYKMQHQYIPASCRI